MVTQNVDDLHARSGSAPLHIACNKRNAELARAPRAEREEALADARKKLQAIGDDDGKLNLVRFELYRKLLPTSQRAPAIST